MKTLLSGICAGALALGLVACGNGGMGTSGAGGEAGAGGGWGVGGAGGVGVGGAGGVGSGGAGSDIGAAPFVLSGTYPLAAGKGTDKLVSGDFDGDGVLDAAFLTTEPDAIQILRGKGGGVLEYATTIPLDESVSILYAIHADADGKLDLVGVKDCFDAAACSAIWTMRGHGDGTFLPPLFSGGEGWFSSSSSDTGDVDGDGDTDIATGIDSNNGGALLRNAGDGKFVIEWSGGAYDLALTDFDEDGILDYVGVDYDWISVLLGNGDGTYQYPGTYFAPDARVHQVVAGDLDADGDEDFVTLSGIHDVSSIDDIIMLFLGAGDGKSFITNELHLGYKHHASPLLADFDGDQDADLALASDGKIIVLYSDGGTFVPGPMITGFSASSILAVDMNGDAKKDLLVGSATGVTVLLNAP